MFKIYDDKVYFVAETPDINKVIEIFLPKDDRGTIMDSHEIRVDLCRAIRKLQHDGYTIMKVYPAMGDRRESIDVLSMPEFIQSAKCPNNDVEEAVVFSYFESGATFQLPCKVNKETHEIFDVTCAAMPCDDDCFSYAEVKINGKDYPVNFIKTSRENPRLQSWDERRPSKINSCCLSSDRQLFCLPMLANCVPWIVESN